MTTIASWCTGIVPYLFMEMERPVKPTPANSTVSSMLQPLRTAREAPQHATTVMAMWFLSATTWDANRDLEDTSKMQRASCVIILLQSMLCFGVEWKPLYRPLSINPPLVVNVSNIPSNCPYVVAVQSDGVDSAAGFASEFHFAAGDARPIRIVTAISDLSLSSSTDGSLMIHGLSCRDSGALIFLKLPSGTPLRIVSATANIYQGPIIDDLLVRDGSIVARDFFGESVAATALTMPQVAPPAPHSIVPRGGRFHLTRRGWTEWLGGGASGETVRFSGGGKLIPVRVHIGVDGKASMSPVNAQFSVKRFALVPSRTPLNYQGRAVEVETVMPFYLDAGGIAIPWPLAIRFCKSCTNQGTTSVFNGTVTAPY